MILILNREATRSKNSIQHAITIDKHMKYDVISNISLPIPQLFKCHYKANVDADANADCNHPSTHFSIHQSIKCYLKTNAGANVDVNADGFHSSFESTSVSDPYFSVNMNHKATN